MSAVACGKRSLFEESYPPVPKRLRCGGGSSPVRFPLWRGGSPAGPAEGGSPQYPLFTDPADQLSQLKALFPDMDDQLIEKALESNGHDLYSAIKSLEGLRLTSDGGESILQSPTAVAAASYPVKNAQEDAGMQPVSTKQLSTAESFIEAGAAPLDRSKWVEVFVQEMLSSTSLDDAKARAAGALEAFEKIAVASFLEVSHKENALLKEQLQNFIRENHILKRAVAIQHERQVEHENCPREIELLKQSIAQYQEQVRTLEVNNYALNFHLRKAEEGTSIPGRFYPDVF